MDLYAVRLAGKRPPRPQRCFAALICATGTKLGSEAYDCEGKKQRHEWMNTEEYEYRKHQEEIRQKKEQEEKKWQAFITSDNGKAWSAANEDIAALVKTMTEKLYAAFISNLDEEANALDKMGIDMKATLDKKRKALIIRKSAAMGMYFVFAVMVIAVGISLSRATERAGLCLLVVLVIGAVSRILMRIVRMNANNAKIKEYNDLFADYESKLNAAGDNVQGLICAYENGLEKMRVTGRDMLKKNNAKYGAGSGHSYNLRISVKTDSSEEVLSVLDIIRGVLERRALSEREIKSIKQW